ncbi:MAG: porin [Muribaculaceae bacterium]|nr:porin [Muribaculaceae bacterium]
MKIKNKFTDNKSLSAKIISCSVFSTLLIGGILPSFAQSEASDSAAGKSVEKERIERLINNTNIITMGDEKNLRDSLSKMLNRFYYDQFRHFQDPRAPYFMFMSRNGNLALGVGGVIRMRGYFDWNGSIPTSGFSPYFIPIPKDPASEKSLSANPSGTALFFTLLGHNSLLGDFRGYIEAGFSGYNNRDFKLKKAYIQSGDWTAGYATTTFEDTKAEPSTIDGAGANGINTRTNVLVRYMHTFKNNHWSVAGSVEIPSSSIDADGTTTKACSDYVPDLAAFLQYQWNGGDSHVRLSGLARVLTYRDLIEEKNYNIMGWAAQFSTVIKVLPQFNLFGIASVGRGHQSYTTDLAGGNFDLVAEPETPGKLYAPMATGYVFGLSYYFSPKVFSNIALSEQRYYPKKNPDNSQYKYGLYGAFNVFWDITPRFEIGAEYLIGKRANFNGEHGNANRITALMMLSF